MTTKNIVLGITGASGVVYGIRILNLLEQLGHTIQLVVSPMAAAIVKHELNTDFFVEESTTDIANTAKEFAKNMAVRTAMAVESMYRILPFGDFSNEPHTNCEPQSIRTPAQRIQTAFQNGRIRPHRSRDFFATIASGSFLTDGMIVAPCSTSSMAAIATGVNHHLIHRTAEVHLKERRKTLLVVRESPYSMIHLQQMVTLTQAGAVILPASPHFYAMDSHTCTAADMVDTVVARVLDQIGVSHFLKNRWK